MTRFVLTAVATLLLAACATAPSASKQAGTPAPSPHAAAVPSPSRAPSAAPWANSVPSAAPSASAFAQGSTVAGVNIGGLEDGEARRRVEAALDTLRRQLTLHVGERTFVLDSAGLLRLPEADELLEQARASQPVEIPLNLRIDREALRGRLESIAAEAEQSPLAKVLVDADAYTSTLTFVRRTAHALDIDAAVEQVARALADARTDQVTLELEGQSDQRLPLSELDRALQEHATYWRGTAGVAVLDLDTGETAGINQDTVFSGASVFKVPIMIYVYSRLGTLDQAQQLWMERMIGDSGNYEATKLLAAAVGGWSTDDAFVAAGEMSAMLRQLGLQHTYMLVPYEGSAYLRREGKLPEGGPAQEGTAPFTAADPFVRTTPAEMARLFAMLDQCAAGGGPLLEQVGDRLSAGLCNDMLALLRLPHDPTRMVAGVPTGISVAHKGGWTSDMQADVGIVDSAGGRYVAAIWVYRDLEDGYVTGPTAKASPYLADFSHTIYSFYNPETPR